MMARGSLCVTRLLRGHLLDKSPEVGQINHESGQKCFELGQSSRAGSVRHKSGSSRRRNRRGELIEVHLEGGEMEAFAVKTLEETIHKMAVKRAAPVWLPFRPGIADGLPRPITSKMSLLKQWRQLQIQMKNLKKKKKVEYLYAQFTGQSKRKVFSTTLFIDDTACNMLSTGWSPLRSIPLGVVIINALKMDSVPFNC
ncbi:hypothetical protein SUGI_0310180 [Cryptomeria japonica]|nr:hypothetical protein SUGI_0310180 [Cryptomeria japonica]